MESKQVDVSRFERMVGQTINTLRTGIFAVNKLMNMTSSETVQRLKNIVLDGADFRSYNLKMGHGGTLDSTAVGVLVIGVNDGCKNLPILLHGSKSYLVNGQMGIATDTYNETGQIIDERPFGHVKLWDLEAALRFFVGEIMQVAPLYSALKVNGRRMSDWTREGVKIPPKERLVRCFSIDCTDFNPPFFTLVVRCGSGFYVRSLVHDIGQVLGTCAHVKQIMRIQQGPFTLHDCLNENEWSMKNILDTILRSDIKFCQYASNLRKQRILRPIPSVQTE